MSILSRYVLKEYLKVLMITLGALVLIFLTIEFLEKIRKFSEKNAELIWVLEYFLYKSPRLVFDVLPLAVLLSTLLTLGGLSKNNEVIAFMSSGVSVFRLTRPLVVFGALLSILLFILNGTLIPTSLHKSRNVQEVKIERKAKNTTLVQNKIWLKLNSRTFFNIQLIDIAQKTMHGVHIYYMGEDFSFPEEIEAQSLIYENGGWILYAGIHRKFQPDGTIQAQTFSRKPIALNKTPEDFLQAAAIPNEMTYGHLDSYIAQLAENGFDSTRYRVDLRGKQAFPFVNLVMVLMGIPFALGHNRSAGIARGVFISLILGLLYFLVFSVSISLGRVGVLAPWLAAWGANLLFLIVALYLFSNIRQ